MLVQDELRLIIVGLALVVFVVVLERIRVGSAESLPFIVGAFKLVFESISEFFNGCNKDSIKADVLDSTDLFKIHDN